MANMRMGQRVLLTGYGYADDDAKPLNPPATGVVVRTLHRNDGGAWVRLDERHADAFCHPFAADDEHGRGCDVLAHPDAWAVSNG